MRNSSAVSGALLVAALALGGCSKAEPPQAAAAPHGVGAPKPQGQAAAGQTAAQLTKLSRKVIRNAELSLEVASPAAAEATVSSLVERLGGYIASSERDVSADEGQRAEARVSLSLRVPSERLDEAVRELKRLGVGAQTEKIGSEDVTEEYIDVDARVSNQRQLEQQLVTILAQAHDVDSALKVHHELATVRTEIDRSMGRKRFLEQETSLAKIALTLSPLPTVVAASPSGLGVSVRRAAHDSVEVANAVVTFGIRAMGVLLPLAVMLGLPLAGLSWWLWRRKRRARLGAAV